MDNIIRFLSRAMLKVIAFCTQLGGLSLIAIAMAVAVAQIDGVTIADIFSPRMVLKMQAENAGMNTETARLKGHLYLQNVATWIVFAVAFCAFMFRLAPSKTEKTFLKQVGLIVGVILGSIGTFGTAFTIMEANKGSAIWVIFTDGHNLAQFVFGTVIAWVPTVIIEAIAIHIATEYKAILTKINNSFYEKLATKVEDELNTEKEAKKRTTIINLNQPIKTGTNDI